MTKDSEEPLTVLICGGGIVGLALALAVKKHLGIMPEIYEKTSTFATEAGAGLGMYPNGLRVLRDISPELLQAVRNAGYPYKSRLWERHDGTEITAAQESILAGPEADLEPIGIRRSSLQKVLYNYIVFQGIKVHFRKPLLSAVEREDGLLEVKFGDGTTRTTQILFGADGAWGKARSIVAGKDEPALKYTGVTCFMGLANVPREGISFPSSDKDDFHAVFFPTAENEQCFQFHMPIPEEEANSLNWGNLSDAVGQAECKKIAAKLRSEGWHEKYIEPLEHTIQAVNVGFALLEPGLKKWVKGHVALVGDAAHPPVPYIGQGAQQGLEDAGVAVSLLKIHCMDEDGKFNIKNFGKAMDLYQKIRIKRSSRVLDFSKALGNMQANRAGQAKRSHVADEALRGEVLMYGTLPMMMNGADHDYKADIVKATEENYVPAVTVEATMKAMDYLLGIDQLSSSSTTLKRKQIQYNEALYKLTSERSSALTDWCFNVMHQLLREVVARHNQKTNEKTKDMCLLDESHSTSTSVAVDEIQEVIDLPDHTLEMLEEDPNSVIIGKDVLVQLKALIKGIEGLYQNNPFHNFEHAVNVAVAVYRFLSKMAMENTVDVTVQDRKLKITDPLTKFSCLLAALIHDADHEGVPNTQLQKEHPRMAKEYKQKAIAEQHSVDVGWALFMEEQFKDLRTTLYKDENEMKLLRQLIVNIILATDICDKSLKDFRNKRWEKAFATKDDSRENSNRKATIGLESLIQASDISHTMQPFQVYTKWNERLFCEMYKAYLEGRSETDPSEFWFKGEIGFFDFYIIPLAKKLQQCEVFGRVSDELLDYAQKNREEWLERGEAPVTEMIERIKTNGLVAAH